MQFRSDVAQESAPCLLIAGAGDIGTRLARLRVARGEQVLGVRRSAAPAEHGIRHVQADIALGTGFAQLPQQAEAVVFCAAPDRRDEAGYRALYVDGLRRLLDYVRTPRLVFVSSAAVYAQDRGEWIDEDAPAQPATFNGRTLLAAERELSGHAGAVVLRLSGIYGPGRSALLRRARSSAPGRRHWSNRIHADDAAAALSHLLDLAQPRPLYLGSDDVPALESDVFAWICEREGLPQNDATSEMTAGEATTGRRIDNRRLRDSGWVPVHPDFRSGYLPLLAGAGV